MSYDTISYEPTSKWNDADVFGNLNSPETQSFLDERFDALVGNSSMQPRGTWRLWSTSLREMLEIKLSRHEAKQGKDGDAMVFARARPTGAVFEAPDGKLTLPLCGRTRDDIEAVTFAGYDIDYGDNLDFTIGRLRDLGYFAILYTTSSHRVRKQSWMSVGPAFEGEWNADTALFEATIDGTYPNPKILEIEPLNELDQGRAFVEHDNAYKYRILFPLAEAFELAPEDPVMHEGLCEEWRNRLIHFAEQRLGLEIDETGCDVNRLFYTPRHKPGDPNWYAAVCVGRPLCIEDMPQTPKVARGPQRGARGPISSQVRGFSARRPILSDGFDLIDWNRDWGRNFLVREFFDILQWDFGYSSKSRNEARIICPSDHNHSSPGDRSACWIKDGEGDDKFVVYCHHNSCSALGTLDQIVELEKWAPLSDDFETLSELLCVASLYRGADGTEVTEGPDPDRYRRWDPTEDDADTSEDAEGEASQ